MRIWCWPGAVFELGQFKVLVAPPERMAALLELPEIVRFHTRYLYHGLSGVLFRVPPIRSEHFEPMACATLDGLMTAVRTEFHTILMIEWSSALVAGLSAEDTGRRMSRLRAALKRRAEISIVIVYAPAMDPALRMVADGADQTVWLVPRPAAPRPSVRVAARAGAQRTLAAPLAPGSAER
ncbi:MAG: hypothetical protein ABFC89_02180 [Methanospirillum sp.]